MARLKPGTLTSLGTRTLPGAGGSKVPPIQYEGFVWRPSALAQAELPPGFQIPLACVTNSQGRLWYHEGMLVGPDVPGSVPPKIALGGMAILAVEGGSTAHQVFSYRVALLLFNYRHFFGEHYGRKFGGWKDLYVLPSARLDEKEKSVLSVVDPKLTIHELLKKGRAAAQREQLRKPNRARIIVLGLSELATASPLHLRPDQISRLTRQALFDLDMEEGKIDKALAHPIVPRLLKAIEDHKDDSQGEFDRWFKDLISHSFKSLAKQKKLSL